MKEIKILTFHELSDVKWFEQIIAYLKNNYKIITIDELNDFYKNKLKLENSFLITVDDGHISFYENIYPVLKKYNVPATLFVSPKVLKMQLNYWFQEIKGYDENKLRNILSEMPFFQNIEIDYYNLNSIFKSLKIEDIHEIINRYQALTKCGQRPFENMTIQNLKEVERSNLVTIGAHTMNHPILANESDEISKKEIQESVYELANLLNHEIKYFAYPNGVPNIDFTVREMNVVKSSGIQLAFSTQFNRANEKSDLAKIPRGEITKGKIDFKTKLFLWEKWRKIINLRPSNLELDQRKKLISLL